MLPSDLCVSASKLAVSWLSGDEGHTDSNSSIQQVEED